MIGVRRTNRNKPDYLDEQHTMDDLDMLLGRADIVAMVLPGGSTTNHIMDERRLRLMKRARTSSMWAAEMPSIRMDSIKP